MSVVIGQISLTTSSPSRALTRGKLTVTRLYPCRKDADTIIDKRIFSSPDHWATHRCIPLTQWLMCKYHCWQAHLCEALPARPSLLHLCIFVVLPLRYSLLHSFNFVANVQISSPTSSSLQGLASETLIVACFYLYNINASIISDKLIFARSYQWDTHDISSAKQVHQ